MSKSELSERLARRMGVSKALTRDTVDGVFGTIGEALARGDDVRTVEFGAFGTRNRPARTGHNPRIGETVEMEPSRAPMFKLGKPLGDAVNAGYDLGTGGGGSGTRNACGSRNIEAMQWR